MYLKRLELQGFKSFAGRTKFEFEGGITGIVGPNGAGKSNIADAIRWVLGEQSLKTLRARQGEDLIFSGSSRKPRAGMAEATLILDNSTDWLDIDFREVAIGRRAHRGGQNEYLLNGSTVRRQDIVELLAKGGLSTNAYTVIGQGLVDMALSMHPEERRKLLEEAAGIHIYQAKRNKAVRDLEQTERNLQRVADILREISPRLRSLERQARRSEKQRDLATALNDKLTRWYGFLWHREMGALTDAREKASAAAAELEARKGILARAVEAEELARDEEQRLRREVRKLRSLREEGRQEIEDLRRRHAVDEERLRGLSERIQNLEAELESLSESRIGLESRIRREEARLEREFEPGAEGVRSEAEVKGIQDRAFRLSSRAAELRTRLGQAGSRAEILSRELARDEGVLQELQEQGSRLEVDEERLANQISVQQKQLAELDVSLSEALADLAGAEQRAERARAELDEADRSVGRLQAKLEAIEAAVPASPDELLDGEGVIGQVSEVLEIPPELEIAVARALGGLLTATVTETWDQAASLIESHPEARVLLVALDSVRVQESPELPRDSGIVGLASRLVEANDRFLGLREGLLGTTVIVRDSEAARRIHRTAPPGLRIVSVDGRVISSPGVLTAGVLASDEEWLLRERRLADLRGELAELERRRARAIRAQEEASGLRDGLAESARELQESRDQSIHELSEVEEAKSRVQARVHQVKQEIGWREAGLRRARSERAELQAEQENLRQRVVALETQEKEAVALLEGSLGRRPALAEAGSDTDLLLSRERLEQSKLLLEGHRERLTELLETVEDRQDRRSALIVEEGELERRLVAVRGKLAEAESNVDEHESRLARLEGELERISEGHRRRQRVEDEARERVRRAESAVTQGQVEIERRKERTSSLRRQMEADLEAVVGASGLTSDVPLDLDARIATLPEVSSAPDGLEREIARLRRRLRQVGGADPEAPAEYQTLLARNTFLSEQREDLRRAQRDLRKVIRELEGRMERRFGETFDAVAAEFSHYFTALFGGGEGGLSLTEPESPSETGVEISARPPGKRRQDVSVLSGGERALTGTALVFAILSAMKVPFCILDEVDATLDEVNLSRFRQELEALAERTQVVMITHNRLSVEAADTLYGITLGDDHASDVLSLRLDGEGMG